MKPGERPDTDLIKLRDYWLKPAAPRVLNLLGYGMRALSRHLLASGVPHRTSTGTQHMLRRRYATALIQSGENAKTVQTLMDHHSMALTMDHYAGSVTASF